MMDDKQINIDNFDQATGNGNPDAAEPGDEREVISDDADARLNERTTGTVERGTDETQGRTVTGEFGDDPETKRATSNEGVDAAAERAAAGEETR